MRATDGRLDSNLSASTSAFRLAGGKYGLTAVATWGGGSAKLQKLAGDGTTYVSMASGCDFTADAGAVVDLPAGQYRWTIATASAVYATIDRVPGE